MASVFTPSARVLLRQLRPLSRACPRVPFPPPSVRPFRSRLYSSKPPSPNPTPSLNSPAPSPSLAQRLRTLSREYGYSALGVYLALSALDFPLCLMAVRWAGTERIGRWEEEVLGWVRSVIPGLAKKEVVEVGVPDEQVGWGVEEASRANDGAGASIWTQVALAYAIHKSFIFIRVPITAAITPKVVKVLRGWGWDIGKRASSKVKPPTK
ncbi:MAG: hypothetical protein M1814_001740 [Vezdaea aestivalis]|nr:MAG: hypothetical protein M1814_001740 [Vezdaea aestivalis]